MKKMMVSIFAIAMLLAVTSCVKFEKLGYDKTGAPSIKTLPEQKMLLAGARGKPEKIAMDCIGSLYSVYFKMNYKGMMLAAPRSRWPIMPDKPQAEWVGIFGIPIPEEVNAVPDLKKKTPVEVKIGYWEYGETAEIVHFGSYDSETKTVETLQKFIKEKGYEISGPHEEVYVKGPGMFGKGDPDKYITLIRYQVKKMEINPRKKKK